MRVPAIVTSLGRWLWRHLSLPGVAVGVLLFAVSLTPSLIPRGFVVQGLLSGCVFATGYAIGATFEWTFHYLGFRLPARANRWLTWFVFGLCALLLAICLGLAAGWQNEVRLAMGTEPVTYGHPVQVVLVALLPAILLVAVGTVITVSVRRVAALLAALLPPRVAFVAGIAIVGLGTALLFSGVLLRGALRTADAFYAEFDTLAGRFGEMPADPLHSGSTASLVRWETIGHDGRIFVESGPNRQEIEQAINREAIEPLRVYVGLRSAETLQERADLALAEMLRVGAFDRSVLVIATPVGQGWVDPAAIDTLEYLMAGDVATVALQYSYLLSPLALVVEPDYGQEAANAIFDTVYRYWTNLPRDSRPRLYLHGLSLGAHHSQQSARMFDVLGDPFDGALWAGPPFTSPTWRFATDGRQAGSPAWKPRYGNETVFRFTNDGTGLERSDRPWGPMRIAFLQHPTDPIVFFTTDAWRAEPAWMKGERGPGVSPRLRWFPVVTFLQLAMDMALSQAAPVGYGHVYSTADYLRAWVPLVEPPGWTAETLDALEAVLPANPARIGLPPLDLSP